MGFFENIYNPDVLTCLANLSSDEVFTPPELVNKMLDDLPQELFASKETKFLDPVSKSGVFLREIAKRLLKNIAKQYNVEKFEDIPNLQSHLDHIFHMQLYGIAITELTSLLSRRSLYCSQYPNGKYSVTKFSSAEGNIRYKKIAHAWGIGEKGKRTCVYCGASEAEYGEEKRKGLESHAYEFIHTDNLEEIWNMKFDVIIGNPPYQMSTAQDSAQAIPLYHRFIQQAKKLNPRYLTMIIPARWFSGGMRLDDFRNEMLNDDRIRIIHDFNSASDCFTGVEIKGGVCYFLWDRDNRGLCKVYTHEGEKILSKSERPLLEKGLDIFIRMNEAIPILHKVAEKEEPSFSEIASAMKPFGLPTTFSEISEEQCMDSVYVYANRKQGYTRRSNIIKNQELIDKWKIFIPKAIGIGNVKKDWIKPILGSKGSVCTETYIMIGPFESKREAENAISYIETKFFHLFLSFKKITQDTLRNTYSLIPLQDFTEAWSDEKLYKKYGFTEEEIGFVESTVRPMDNGGEDDE